MRPDAGMPRSTTRVDLRFVFAWTFYVAVGLAIGGAGFSNDAHWGWGALLNAHEALFAMASAAMAAVLVKQSLALRKLIAGADVAARAAMRLESQLRLSAAVALIACLVMRLLIARKWVDLPDSTIYFLGDPLTDFLWWSLIVAVLVDVLVRARSKTARRGHVVVNILTWIVGLSLATYIAVDQAFISYLTHVACWGIDGAHVRSEFRYPITTRTDEYLLLASAAAALGAVVGGGAIAFSALPRLLRGKSVSVWRVGACLALLGGASWYVAWYRYWALPYYSPDLSSVSTDANWFQLAGAALLVAATVTFAAYRMWHAAFAPSRVLAAVNMPVDCNSWLILWLVVVASLVFVAELIYAAVTSTYGHPIEEIVFCLTMPQTYFILAIGTIGIRLLWLRRHGPRPAPLAIVPLRAGPLMFTWLVLVLLLTILACVISAFSLSYWLGPWYRR